MAKKDGYEEMVKSMDASAKFLERVRAARGPSERQRAQHEADMAASRLRKAGKP